MDVVDAAKTPPAALDADIAALVNMGLKPSDIERIYHAVHGVDAEAVKEACRRLVGSQSVEIGRQVSVGLALLNSDSGAAAPTDIAAVVKSLQEELDDNPPERFKDPISFSFMSDPQVISSGYVFDKSTLFDESGRLRLRECPMTRQELKPFVFPLNFLKREIIEWKLRRLDAVVSAAQKLAPITPAARESINALIKVAESLLGSLDSSTYQHQALALWRLKRSALGKDTPHSERRALLTALQAAARRDTHAELHAFLEEFTSECAEAGIDVTPELFAWGVRDRTLQPDCRMVHLQDVWDLYTQGARVRGPGDPLGEFGGEGKHLVWERGLGTSDFAIESRVRVARVDATALAFEFWSAGGVDHLGFDGADGCKVFLGHGECAHWREQPKGSKCPFVPGSWQVARFVRSAGRLSVTIDGMPVPLFTNVPMDWNVLAFGWRPRRSAVDVEYMKLGQPDKADAALVREQGTPQGTPRLLGRLLGRSSLAGGGRLWG